MEAASKRPGVARLVWFPILGLLMGAVAAGAASLTLGMTYSSTAVVLLHDARSDSPAGADLGLGFIPSRIVENNIEVIRSRAVLESVVDQVGLEDVQKVTDRFAVIAPSQNADLLEITARGATAGEAQELSRAILQSFVEYQRADEIDRLEREVSAIRQEIGALEPEAGDGEPGSAQTQVVASRLSELSTRLDRQLVALSLADGGVTVIDEGHLPLEPQRSAAQDAMFGGFLGLLVGLAMAVLLLRWPGRSRHSE